MPPEHMRTVQQRIDSHMEDALYRAFEHVWDDVNTERFSKDEAWAALCNWDMGDYFNDWWAEGDE